MASFVLSTGTSYFADNRKRGDDYRVAQIKSLTDSMTQFQIHAAALANLVIETKNAPQESRRAVLDNLNEQFAKLKQVRPLLPASAAPQVDAYLNAILAMQEVVTSSDLYQRMGVFWTTASKLLVARNRLNEELHRSV